MSAIKTSETTATVLRAVASLPRIKAALIDDMAMRDLENDLGDAEARAYAAEEAARLKHYSRPLPAIDDGYLTEIRSLYDEAWGNRDRTFYANVSSDGAVEEADDGGGSIIIEDGGRLCWGMDHARLVAALLNFAAHLNEKS